MAENAPTVEGEWPVGWDGHERAQLLRSAALPLALKLQWLEEAQRLVEHLHRQGVKARASTNGESST